MKNILLPTDFSPASERSIGFAVEMAKVMCAKIIVTNTSPLLNYSSDVPLLASPDFYEEEEVSAKLKMKKICMYINAQFDVCGKKLQSESIHAFDAISHDIVSLCKEKSIELVVMGSNGKENLFGFFESTTLEVMDLLSCPLLIVQKDSVFHPFKNIVFALEKLNKDILNTGPLLSLVRRSDPFISILQMTPLENGHLQDTDTSEEEFVFLKAVKDATNFSKIRIRKLLMDDPEKKFIQYLEHKEVDLLVLQKQERFWLKEVFHKSFTKNILKKSNLPVLILPSIH